MATLDLVRRQDGANVRASEGAGTTTLTSADARWQIFNISAARNCTLPSTGILAGDIYTINNRSSSFALTVKSSDNTTITTVTNGGIKLAALQDAPTSSSHWLISPGSDYLPGKAAGAVDGSVIPAGYVGELVLAEVTSDISIPGTTGVWGNASQNLPLTAGVWHISASVYFARNGATVSGLCGIGISTNSTPSAFADQNGNMTNLTYGTIDSATSQLVTLIIPKFVVRLSGNQTYYIKILSTHSAGTPNYRMNAQATRMA